jgi:iron complex outermembrane receptor protein
MDFGLGDLGLTSVTTYIDRQVEVKRDASQLTGSVTFGFGVATPEEVRLDSPLYDDTDLQVFSQEIRLASTREGPMQWLVGAFYQQADRKYGQTLPTPGYDAITLRLDPRYDSAFFNAPPDTPYYSRLSYDFSQFAIFGEATYRFSPAWALTAGLRYYDFSEDRVLTFAGIFADQGYTDEPGSTSSDGFSPRVILAFNPDQDVQFTAQASRGFRLGGINDPLNVGLCTPEDLETYGGHPTWDDENVTNYELGAKSRFHNGQVTLNASMFVTEIDGLQVIADADSCSSRIVLNADARTVGTEIEMFLRPDEHRDFGLSMTYVKAKMSETRRDSDGNVIAGIRDGNRMPTSPDLQLVGTAGYTWSMGSSLDSNLRFTIQSVSTSFTQLADQEPNFGLILRDPTGSPGAAQLIDFGDVSVDQVAFDAELASYAIGNLRWGVSSGKWEASVYVNNIGDTNARLSIDRERGRRARVGYLTNPPRTYGASFRFNF